MKKKLFWTIVISFTMIFVLAACGGQDQEPQPEPVVSCESSYTMENRDGAGVYFYGEHWLGIEGQELVLHFEDQVLYRENISDTTVLFGEIQTDQQGIRITAQKSGNDICFIVDHFLLQTFDELMLIQPDINWERLSQSLREQNLQTGEDNVGIVVGVRHQETGKLMIIPGGLVLPHNEGWINPGDQKEGYLNTFFVPTNQVSGAISRVQYEPQLGWELRNTITIEAGNGDQFIVYEVMPTVEVVSFVPFGYKGAITRLYVQGIAPTGVVSMYGYSDGEWHNFDSQLTSVIFEIPESPYDPNGISGFLSEIEVGFDNQYQPALVNGFEWTFDTTQGILVYNLENK